MSESLAEQLNDCFATVDDCWCNSVDCPRGCAKAAKALKAVAVAEDKAAALDLLEQWLDVHPERNGEFYKKDGKLVAVLRSERLADSGKFTAGRHLSKTQETLASAIRTVLQVAISNGDGLK